VDPQLNGRFAMVPLGEDVGEPDGDEPAVGESLMERMARQDAVDGLGDAEFDQEGDEQGDIIDPLVDQFQGGAAVDSRRPASGAIRARFAGRIPGDNHGSSPTKPEWKAGLYRSGCPERKIQAKEREHGYDR